MAEVNLRSNCLSFTELVAQAVALISPTMTAALIIPVMYSNTGDSSWMAYALGSVMLLFVAFNLNQFAKRSTSSGSMYAYICRGLGLNAGAVGGWSLIWAYLGIAMAGVTGFSIFAGNLLDMVGLSVPPIILFGICVAVAWFCAWKNVQLSAVVMLILEGLSMALIIVLCFVVLKQRDFAVDHVQFDFKNTPVSSMGLGVVVAIFSLVGFECATAFGDEAKNPLKSIPRAVITSLVISGVFFVFVTYTMVFATRGYTTTLDMIDKPLNVMAQIAHVGYLQPLLSLGAMSSFFALCLSCLSAGARVIYAMGRHGLFHSATGGAHAENKTPHIAITLMALIAFIVPTIGVLGQLAPLDIFNYVGTMAAFGFLVPYFLVSVAAPAYLKRLGEIQSKDYALCAGAVILLLVPAVGSVYPVPAAPVNYFPYIFLVYLGIGIAWILSVHRSSPTASIKIRQDLEMTHSRYQIHSDDFPIAGTPDYS